MSALIEKVARAMCADAGYDPYDIGPNDGPRWMYYEPQARAAIKTVLSHYSDPRNISDRMADARLTELNIDDIRSNHRTAIAVAMAAALKQLGDSK